MVWIAPFFDVRFTLNCRNGKIVLLLCLAVRLEPSQGPEPDRGSLFEDAWYTHCYSYGKVITIVIVIVIITIVIIILVVVMVMVIAIVIVFGVTGLLGLLILEVESGIVLGTSGNKSVKKRDPFNHDVSWRFHSNSLCFMKLCFQRKQLCLDVCGCGWTLSTHRSSCSPLLRGITCLKWLNHWSTARASAFFLKLHINCLTWPGVEI